MKQHSERNLLTLTDVTKRFGGLTANDKVNLTAKAGEIVGVIGPNGSGKTTLFSSISGFHLPNEGSIELDDRQLVGMLPHQINAVGIARTFQVVKPFAGLPVIENVMIGALIKGHSMERARENSLEILEFLGMGDAANKLASELSLPQMKRLEVAKAMATEPRILLLDEIMAGLRPVEVDRAIVLIKAIRDRGITILLVEHLMRAVMALCDRLFVLHHGEMIAHGKPREVIEDPQVVEAYFGKAANHA